MLHYRVAIATCVAITVNVKKVALRKYDIKGFLLTFLLLLATFSSPQFVFSSNCFCSYIVPA